MEEIFTDINNVLKGMFVFSLYLALLQPLYYPPSGLSVYVGGVDVNVHVALLPGPSMIMLDGILSQSITKANNCARVEPAGNVAVHVPSVGVAVCPPTVEGLHVAVGGVGGVTVVLPSGQVTARQVTGVLLLILSCCRCIVNVVCIRYRCSRI
jgi:hypothetical protein